LLERQLTSDPILERYRQELARRLVGRQMATKELTGGFAHLLADPFQPIEDRAALQDEVDVAIVGGGLAGLLVAVRLREAGVERIRVIDRAGSFGGTWYWNRYPGAMCDIESYIYLPLLEEMGYVPKHKYSYAPEIYEYLQSVADRYDLRDDALFHTGVEQARWVDGTQSWVITTDRGDEFESQFLCLAVGFLTQPKIPDIDGLESFRGHCFHTSRWDYAYTGGDASHELTGLGDNVVGIIGTAASAVQCIPWLARSAKQLYVFQRTPSTVSERDNRLTDSAWAASLKPGWQRERMINFTTHCAGLPDPGADLVNDGWTNVVRRAILYPDENIEVMERIRKRVEATVADARTAEFLKPYYAYLCTRPCFHDEYLETFNRPNVEVIECPLGIDRMAQDGPVIDGTTYPVDCLIFATGFQGPEWKIESLTGIVGRGGVSLTTKWADGIQSLHGLMTHGFPNLLIQPGPLEQSTGTFNHTHVMVENAGHLAYIVAEMRRRGHRCFDVSVAAEADWVRQIVGSPPEPYGKDGQISCTPSRLNYVGRETGPNPRNGIYGGIGGPLDYFAILADWRTEGNLAGLEFDPVLSAAQ